MTIEEIITKEKEKAEEFQYAADNYTVDRYFKETYKNTADYHTTIANIVRKYQKIQEIVRWNNAPSPYYKPDGQLFREIIEVLESEETNDNM